MVTKSEMPTTETPWLARWYAYAGDPWTKEGEADLAARSPLNFVDRVRGPTLIVGKMGQVRSSWGPICAVFCLCSSPLAC